MEPAGWSNHYCRYIRFDNQRYQTMAPSKLLDNVTTQFSTTLFQFYFIIKGMIGSMLLNGSIPLFYFYFGVSAYQLHIYRAMMFIPWAWQGLVGAISDTFPLCGHHKRWYSVVATLLLPLGLIGVGLSEIVKLSVVAGAVCSIAIMINGVLFEGQVSSLMRFSKASKNLPTYVWGIVMAGSIPGAIFVGVYANKPEQAYRIKTAFLIAIVFAVQLLYPLLRYPQHVFAGDHKESGGVVLLTEQLKKRKYQPQKPTNKEWSLVGVMVAASSLMFIMLLTIADSLPLTSFLCAIGLSIILIVFIRTTYQDVPLLVDICTFSFVSEIFHIDISGIMDAFYTARDGCLIGGPAFDLVFYATWVGIVSGVVGSITALAYSRLLHKLKYRGAIQTAVMVRICASLTDIIIIKRWNITHLGISDKAFYIMGDAIITPVATMLVLLPLTNLTNSVVKRGKETVTYSIMVGFQSLGATVSRIIGAYFMHLFDTRANLRHGCNFDNLIFLVVVTRMLFSYLNIPLAYWMIPNAPIISKKRGNIGDGTTRRGSGDTVDTGSSGPGPIIPLVATTSA
jgi:hypothetical protein